MVLLKNQRTDSKLYYVVFLPVIIFIGLIFLANVGRSFAQEVAFFESPVALLQEKQRLMSDKAAERHFRRPLSLSSQDTGRDLQGEIHALLDHPFADVAAALKTGAAWCDILSLHLNIKYCRHDKPRTPGTLSVYVGRKHEQPLDQAFPVRFAFRVDAGGPDYLRVVLEAEKGPFDTRDYRILLEAIPAEEKSTFLRFTYSYETSFIAAMAMQVYFNTIGGDKIGFTVIETRADGSPVYASKMRGLIERNTMRYFLALEAYFKTFSVPVDQRLDLRLQRWFSATEQYARQLHEMDLETYMTMKRREYSRQAAEDKIVSYRP